MSDIIREAVVTATTNMGAGIVRDGGRVVFVSGAVCGDVVDVIVTRRKSSYAEGEISALLTPSQYRITPDCDAFCRGCGGCTFRHVTYEHELSVKSDYIRACLHKSGIDVELAPFLTAGADAVRSKVTVPISGGVSGYYSRGTHEIVASERCRLHDIETDVIRSAVANAGIAGLHHVTVRRGSEGVMVILRCDGSISADEVRDAVGGLNADSIWLDADGALTLISGADAIYDTLAGCRFRISPESFYQVNHAGAELLYDCAIKGAALRGGERVADLYCGTGTIGIAAAKRAGNISLTGVEIVKSAVADAKINAAENGVDATFICGDAVDYTDRADCVFLDPPRVGCGGRLISHLCRIRPQRIVYVSCEPATMARDAAKLVSSGYGVASVTPVDMFPRTGKVECVTVMEKQK